MSERGTLLGGRYELDQIIGRGGMAEVWRARDVRLNRDVAVKRLRIDLASDPTFQARFRREAQSAAGLNHPNIVAVYDTGEERDTKSDVMIPFIIMELVEGVTLREVLRDGRKIVPERALEFTAGVLDALAYSHRAGIIHRDIKPANVMLTPSGTVKVMDFGIARAVADTSATMTQTAAVIGTAQYLSPEQARGEKVDNRSDLYSVGCLLYELLCSEPPFKGDSPVSVAYQHVREAPIPPSHRDPEVTPPMDAITLKALAKSPDARYQDAREFREDIMRCLNGQPVMASFSSPADVSTRVMPASPNGARRAAPTELMEPPLSAAEATSPGGVMTAVEDEEEQPKKKRTGLIVLLSTMGVLLLAGIIWAVSLLNARPPEIQKVAVPTVVGQAQADAEAQLKSAGLVAEVKQIPSTDEQRGKVVETSPKAGTEVEKDSKVTLSVGSGPNTLKVPDVTGMTFDKAKQTLTTAGFTGEITEQEAKPAEEPSDAKKGNVISSKPEANTNVAADQAIVLTIATGKSEVPDLTGKTSDEAQRLAKERGFEVKVTEQEQKDSSQQVGRVFAQDPKAGSALSRGSSITITVVTAAKTAVVPDMNGMTEAQAREAFKKAGFTASLTVNRLQTNSHQVDRVYQQDHAAGEELDKGETVTVDIAINPPAQPSPSPSASSPQPPSPSPTPTR